MEPEKEELFQSTLLMRGATTIASFFRMFSGLFQSTLLMRGATCIIGVTLFEILISIHAPHARSDGDDTMEKNIDELFQSTLLMRGATT